MIKALEIPAKTKPFEIEVGKNYLFKFSDQYVVGHCVDVDEKQIVCTNCDFLADDTANNANDIKELFAFSRHLTPFDRGPMSFNRAFIYFIAPYKKSLPNSVERD